MLAFVKLWVQLYFLAVTAYGFSTSQNGASGPYAQNDMTAVPSFIVIGTAKGGTTDLYAQLTADIVNKDPARPEPPIVLGVRKELAFLPRIQPHEFGGLTPGGPRYMEYLSQLGHSCANATSAALSACMHEKGREVFTLDASPTYLSSEVAPQVLQILSPNTKVIAMLRDPIERAEIYFRHILIMEGAERWKQQSIDDLAEKFFGYVQGHAEIHLALTTLKGCTDAPCMARGWANLAASGLLHDQSAQLFTDGLYRYALANWYTHYLKPGRFMLIDSDAYYGNRTATLDQVTRFLYGRGLTPSERLQADSTAFMRKGPKALSTVSDDVWVLSPIWRDHLKRFYNEHVLDGFNSLLANMRNGGAWIVGFDGEPWNQASR